MGCPHQTLRGGSGWARRGGGEQARPGGGVRVRGEALGVRVRHGLGFLFTVFFFKIELLYGSPSISQILATSSFIADPIGQKLCQFRINSRLAHSVKKLAKCGDFLSRKRKMVVHGKFHHQSGGFMLLTRLHIHLFCPLTKRISSWIPILGTCSMTTK
jgi:hypothetical protein